MDNRRRMMWKKPQLNAIYYTSTDGNRVTPYSTSAFNVSIKSNTYTNGLGIILFNGKLTTIGADAFHNCNKLLTVELPNTVTTIGEEAFMRCTALTSVIIPDSVTSIGKNAFAYSTMLEYVDMGALNVNIEQFAFRQCPNTYSVFDVQNASVQAKAFYESGGELIVGNTKDYSSSGDSPFAHANFSKIIIVDGTTSIGNYSFYGIKTTNYIYIPSSVTYIGNKYSFEYVTGVLEIHCNINDAISNTAGSRPFYEAQFNKIIIGDEVTNIGRYAFTSMPSLTSLTLGQNLITIGDEAFKYDSKLTSISIPDSVTTLGNNVFANCTSLSNVIIGSGLTSISYNIFANSSSLSSITITAPIAPTIVNTTFQKIASNGTLYYPAGSDYSSWLSTSSYYLGYYGWTSQWLYTPQTYYDLSITAQDVIGNITTTTISWTCMSDGIDPITGGSITGIQLSGTATSEEFPQNTSETETVERTITFEYQGLTASTTITQGVWIKKSYELVLNDNWQLSTAVANPDSALYDGVYESFSNYNKNSTAAIMYIDIVDCETFKLYIRSYAESNYDYVMVSQIDQTIDNNSSYSNTTLVKAHTRGTQKSGTTISDYKLVEFTGLDGGEHRITVVYRKDGSGNSGTDKGYLIIPRQ